MTALVCQVVFRYGSGDDVTEVVFLDGDRAADFMLDAYATVIETLPAKASAASIPLLRAMLEETARTCAHPPNTCPVHSTKSRLWRLAFVGTAPDGSCEWDGCILRAGHDGGCIVDAVCRREDGCTKDHGHDGPCRVRFGSGA